MTAQLSLLPDPQPTLPPGIEIIHGDVTEAIRSAQGARLVVADPPWTYSNAGTRGNAADQYALGGMDWIASTLVAAYEVAAPDAYLLLWATWPLLAEWWPHMVQLPWRYLTGGSWHKLGGLGVGFHVRGDSEPWFLLAKGKPRPAGALSNAPATHRQRHSEKPVEFLREAIAVLCPPDGLVLSLWSGMCPEARAAYLAERRLVGAEIDAERRAAAIGMLAQTRRG